MINYINSNEEWNAMATRHVDKKNIIIVCFGAEWCGPCRALEPKLKNLAETYIDYEFYKVDIDKCPIVADKFNVSSVPTTMIIKDCNIYKTIVGVDILGLQTGLDNI
jgi:thioredoxin 1